MAVQAVSPRGLMVELPHRLSCPGSFYLAAIQCRLDRDEPLCKKVKIVYDSISQRSE
jgi:hypothetical protein